MPTYVREGKWQVMIHGESYKPIVSEAAKKATGGDNSYQRIFISHLLKDSRDANRIAGAVGFFRGSYAIGPCADNNWLTLG